MPLRPSPRSPIAVAVRQWRAKQLAARAEHVRREFAERRSKTGAAASANGSDPTAPPPALSCGDVVVASSRSSCREIEASRRCECGAGRNAKCLASISRDVRRIGCEVAAQGNRTVADIDLLRRQILARLASIETSLACLAGTPITARDINDAPNAQFEITRSGHYCLAENVVAQTRFPFVPIVILAPDVTLDLGSFVLESFPGGTFETLPSTAIQILAAQNVVLRNGTIRGFASSIEIFSGDLITLEGLRLLRWSFDASFNDVTSSSGQALGVSVSISPLMSSSTSAGPSNVTIRSCAFDEGRGIAISATVVNGLLIEDCLITNMLPIGLPIPPASAVDVMTAINIVDFAPASANLTLRRLLLEHFVEVPTSAGVGLFTFNGVSLETLAPDATVFQRNLLLEDVVVQDVQSPANLTAEVVVFSLIGSFLARPDLANAGPRGVVLRRCVARDVQVGGTTNAISFVILFLVEGESVVIEDSVAQRVVYIGPPNGNVGLEGIQVHNRGVRLSRNTVTEIDATAATAPTKQAIAIGITTCDCGITGSLVEQNYVAEVRTTPAQAAATDSAGFLFLDTVQTLVRQNVSNRNSIGFRTQTDATSPFTSRQNVFDSNTAIGNDLQGFLDVTPLALNAYTNNLARSNPGGNFSDLPSGTPTVTWTIGTGPPPTDKLSNVSILP